MPVGPRVPLVQHVVDAELEPAVGDDVERRRHVGQHGGMAVVDTGDQHAHAQPLGGLRQRRQRSSSPPDGPVESGKIG